MELSPEERLAKDSIWKLVRLYCISHNVASTPKTTFVMYMLLSSHSDLYMSHWKKLWIHPTTFILKFCSATKLAQLYMVTWLWHIHWWVRTTRSNQFKSQYFIARLYRNFSNQNAESFLIQEKEILKSFSSRPRGTISYIQNMTVYRILTLQDLAWWKWLRHIKTYTAKQIKVLEKRPSGGSTRF